MTMNHITSFLALAILSIIATTIQQASAALPIQHLPKPTVLWNSAIQSPPSVRNIVQISPDDKWLYITTREGELYKLDPANGDYLSHYTPEKRTDGTAAGTEWPMYGGEGIAIHNNEEGEGGSYLVYWVLDVDPKESAPSTRVIAIEHDPDSTDLKVLWTKSLAGTISGTPLIGSEGKFIYFTMNAPTGSLVSSTPPTMSPIASNISTSTNSSVTNTPTISPVDSNTTSTNSPVTNIPTISPVDSNTSSTNSPVTNAPTISPVYSNTTSTNSPVTNLPTTFTNLPTASPVATNATSTNGTVSNTPTTSPVAINTTSTNLPVTTNTPTVTPAANKAFFTFSPVANNFFDRGASEEELGTNPSYWWAEAVDDQLVCVNSAKYPEEYLTNETLKNAALFSTVEECCSVNAEACSRERQREHHENPQQPKRGRRNLQSTGTDTSSGKFVILSHPLDGELVYEFDSRDEFSIQKHRFASAGIAQKPEFGNYNGGFDNTNDVIMWGSQPGREPLQGETMLFQLPKGFNMSDVPDTSQFRPRVLESVAWTTTVRPTFSDSGLDVYFAVSGNSFTGWNKGQKFDVVANLGPIISLPLESEGLFSGSASFIVLTDDDSLLLTGSSDHDIMFAADAESGGSEWILPNMGLDSLFTTPQISSDGDIAYFGKKGTVHAVNLTDGSVLWGEGGFLHPSNTASDPSSLAEFSLSSTGEFLYYAPGGSRITAVRVADVIPTLSPLPPTSAPSLMPSSAPSFSPSKSVMPSTSLTPTVSTSPSVDPDFVPPSSSPTLSILPSSSPSASQSGSPSASSSHVPSLPPSVRPVTLAPLTASPVYAEAVTAAPSPSPIIAPPNANPPSAAAEIPDSSTDEDSFLSTTAIIGIAVGGGVGLILLLSLIWYACKNKNGEDDGVDTNWQTENANANVGKDENVGRDEETKFQYGGEEGDSQLRW